MKITQVLLISCFLFALSVTDGRAQEASVQLGANEIGLNQYFTIAISVKNDNIREHSVFPDIAGFVKRGTRSQSNTSYVNGQVTSSHSIIQNYQPTAQGEFNVPAFRMIINKKTISSKGSKIKVGEAIKQQRRSRFHSDDPIDNFFGRRAAPTEYVDVKADAFLALSTSKKDVYVGEGFTATLAFYVSESNRADMRFFELGKQVTEIVKQIKPERCWEENFNVENITGEPITLDGKSFTKYTIYQAAFFPLNVEDIKFPSVSLELIKYNVAKNPSFFGNNREEDHQTFRSSTKTVRVKDLPPHPLKEKVSVGEYNLRDDIDTKELATGQSFNYSFDIVGTGNISAIVEPTIPEDGNFDFYAPNTRQNVNRGNGRVSGGKSFNYYGIPQEPGEYDLGDYFNWIYFNTRSEQYDTLRSDLIVNVSGASRKNENILSNDVGDFYDRITDEKNSMVSVNGDRTMRIIMNVFVGLALVLTALVLFRKTA